MMLNLFATNLATFRYFGSESKYQGSSGPA